MKIRFNDSDPRAGMVVTMDSSRGRYFVEIGAAVEVKEGAPAPEAPQAPTAPAPETSGKPSDGLKVDELKAALEAKGIKYPDGAKKQDLADLLDGAQ
ncbi:HeH/LEM domain-containing protein [Variovorax sp. tm]|uniref:HeH/LEM domain-containing protein n=1 Tax=Variovorax atrisoli TaxID=3394203 RepID=UPI003A80380E